jgi:hypothetical protein
MQEHQPGVSERSRLVQQFEASEDPERAWLWNEVVV